MIRWLKRQYLVWLGFASSKIRKTRHEGPWTIFFEKSLSIRLFLIALFILSFFLTTAWPEFPDYPLQIFLKIAVWVIGCVWILGILQSRIWRSARLLTLTFICLLTHIIASKILFIAFDYFWHIKYSIDPILAVQPLVAAPVAIMLATILIDARTGMILALIGLLGETLFIHTDFHPHIFLSSFIIYLAAVSCTYKVRTRAHLIRAGFVLSAFILLASWALLAVNRSWPTGSWWTIQMIILFWSLAVGMGSAILVGILLPLFEWAFDSTTDISWLEWTDLNHPLLKRLTMEAPGTYHHSLMVGNLAEAAAEKIGANPTMCRVMAYFHDIGKLTKPEYFIENTSIHHDLHHNLTPSISALIIIGHVKEGIDLGLTYKLPRQVIDGIEQHHGTTLVYYFYRKAIQQQKDVVEGGKILGFEVEEKQEVDAESFRYPGPIPQFPECAIVSLADSIESSSRTLRHPTAQNIEQLVRGIISRRLSEGELNDSDLTLNQIEAITQSFIFTLKTMLHARIDYPKHPAVENKDVK